MQHLVALDERWSLWRWACLRGAGFPVHMLAALSDAGLARAADAVLEEDRRIAARRGDLISVCRAASERDDPELRRAVQRALKRVWQHKVPDPIGDPAIDLARDALALAHAARDALAATLAVEIDRARRESSTKIRAIAADDRFRQAVLWQNQSAVRTGVDWLLRQSIDATDAETRKNERMIASYLQRYCAKNDTIGFFGPVGWARLGDTATAVVQRPGPSLLAARTVYFEYWAIDALAAKLAEDPAMRPFMTPRLLPRFRIADTTLHYPIGREAELEPEVAAVAQLCDGVRTAREIATELGDESVFDSLDELVEAKVIAWTFEIPTAVIHPDAALAAQLARIDDVEPRARAESALGALRERLAAVAAARDAPALAGALAAFDAAFTTATDAESRRAHGQTYAGRTPLYEDCRRDHTVEFGRGVLDRLAGPLALVLQSARWYTHEIASRYRRALAEVFRAASPTRAPLDFADFWQHVPALFPGARADGSIAGAVRDELQRRWATILAIAPDDSTVVRSAAALATAVADAFAAPGPGWPAARHQSPDLLIAAADEAAIARGEFLLVLGELHSGFNTVSEPLFVKQHVDPDELVRAKDADLDRTCIAPVWSKAVTRGDYYSMSSRDLDLETGATRSARPRDHVLVPAQLLVEARDGYLEVVTRDGAHRFDIIAFLEHHLIAESFAAFSPIGSTSARMPRVTIDDVVIARETWRIDPKTLAWLAIADPAARFVAARTWARSIGLPRWVFARTVEEIKPVYVDFDSLIFIDLLAKQLRAGSFATLSEMLPHVEQSWVEDAERKRYTAELRTVAVDPVSWHPERCWSVD